MNPFKLLADNGVFTKPLPVDARSFETVNAIDCAITAVTAQIAFAIEGVEGAESLAFVSHLVLGSQFGQLFTLFQGLKESQYFQQRGWTGWEKFSHAHCPNVNVKTAFNHRKFFATCLQYPNIALISVTTYSEFMRNHRAFIANLKGEKGETDAILWRADRTGKMQFLQELTYQMGQFEAIARFAIQVEEETEQDFLRQRVKAMDPFNEEEKLEKDEIRRREREDDEYIGKLGLSFEELGVSKKHGLAPRKMYQGPRIVVGAKVAEQPVVQPKSLNPEFFVSDASDGAQAMDIDYGNSDGEPEVDILG